MLPAACAGKYSQSVAIRLGHCYTQFVANEVSAADCPHCPLTVCRLRCALTELSRHLSQRVRAKVDLAASDLEPEQPQHSGTELGETPHQRRTQVPSTKAGVRAMGREPIAA
eukprot:scaffold36024_cov75-Phaeocystis_antarctica.AAC.6